MALYFDAKCKALYIVKDFAPHIRESQSTYAVSTVSYGTACAEKLVGHKHSVAFGLKYIESSVGIVGLELLGDEALTTMKRHACEDARQTKTLNTLEMRE